MISISFLFSSLFMLSDNYDPLSPSANTLDSQLNSLLLSLPVMKSDETIDTLELSSNCTEAFELLLDSVTNLTRCSLRYARPVRICTKCWKEFNATVDAYSDLKKRDAECQQFLFSSDQLGVINYLYTSGHALWSQGYCQDCYNKMPDVENFFAVSQKLTECIQDTNKSAPFISKNSTCSQCHDFYANMSETYNKFVSDKKEFETGICMDVIDTMNISRRLWAEYHCIVVFDTNIGPSNVITALVFGIMPFLFYLLARNIARIEDVKIVRPKRKFTVAVTQNPSIGASHVST